MPDELVQLVGYFELLTDRVMVDLLTISSYEVGDSRVLVPQRIDPGNRLAELTAAEASAREAKALRPGSQESRAAMAEAPAAVRTWLEPLVHWAEGLEKRGLIALASYRGKNQITTLLPRFRHVKAGLVTVVLNATGAALQFQPSVFRKWAPDSIAVVEGLLGARLTNGKRITEVPDGLLAALTSAYEEATGADVGGGPGLGG
ncbi:hypothetical protein JIG36_24690 [Actinoplanes sp. LDG1-06]|uniref:Uncharacterized protein n=1 Tax=Paractinoplanes ovalisporus TaxID=2810368 RepID=A0ABS2AG17_9ACTN|nr:hypothetical protein [Actinoplanes ovalisporus]MBM2618760.1 hypothetical protein [Actinoplanes ovalisporus]